MGSNGLMGSPSSGSSSSGFALLPPELQKSYTGYADLLNKQIANPGGVTKAFTPTPFSAAENTAIGNVNKGFAPTQESINSDIGMQMNPYDKYVIDEINRQSGGDYSILKQAQNAAGQSGSNRGMLGANDIDLSRLNQIGGFKQNQYNTALQNALTTLPGARSTDALTQLGVGENVRGLSDKTNQSEFSGLSALAQLLGILPESGGGSGTETGAKKGLLDYAGQAAQAYAASDIRLKENIKEIGMENGHKIYEFSYKGGVERFVGVMAQDVEKTNPEAVIDGVDGFKSVNYDVIGVKFRRMT